MTQVNIQDDEIYSTREETEEVKGFFHGFFLRIKRKLIKIWLIISIILFVVFLVIVFYRRASYQITNTIVKKILEETPIQLVTNTMVTNVICTVDDVPTFVSAKIRNTVFGKSTGIFITKVRYVFGLDLLNEFTEGDVIVDETSITITLPEPKTLYKEIDLNYDVITKTPIWRSLVDAIAGVDVEKEMRKVFEAKATDFAVENGLIPSKSEIIKRLEPFFNKRIDVQTNKKIIFK
jgi:hypothetical protein